MINIKAILASLFCAVAPVSSLVGVPPKSEVNASNYSLGKETVSQIRSSYESGEYDAFLEEVDASFKNADLSGLIQMRSKEIPVKFQEEWEAQFLALQKEKNQELLNALDDKDSSGFAQKVRSSASTLLTPEQEKALSKLNSFIAMTPSAAKSSDEKRLIEIDLEYEYKLLHASLPTKEDSLQKTRAQQLALRMEKMDKMVEASKSFQDLELKKAVGIAADTFDARMARNLDGADLNAYLKSKAKPANATEESVLRTLSFYQDKFSDLLKEIDQSNR